jgi:ferric-dicitrate binding protein FerR (iron transport regulator)
MSTRHRTRFQSLAPPCQAVRETISAELDGEASEIESAAARRHRAECPDCRRFAESIERTTAAVREAPALAPSRRLVPAPSRVAVRGLAVAGFAAAMFVAAMLGAGLASRVTHAPAPSQRHDLVVARGSDRDSIAREQMLIRQMLHAQALDRQAGSERLG